MPRDGRVVPAIRGQLGHRGRQRALLALASTQHWIVTFAQLLDLGFSAAAVDRLVAAGRLHRLHRSVYAVGHPDASVYGRRLAAVWACGPGAALSHISAAAHLGLRASAATRLDVTVPRRSHRRHRGIRVHRSTTLIDEDVTVVDVVPCTSVARTLLDVASLLDRRGLEKAIERAEILEVYDHRALEDVLRRAAKQPGSRRLCEALESSRPGETLTASDLEERMLGLCRLWGLPLPSVNAHIELAGCWEEVDFLWREQRVVVETDGYRFHRSRPAFRRDRRRDRLLECEGYRHARFADEEFDDDLPHIEAVIRHLLGL